MFKQIKTWADDFKQYEMTSEEEKDLIFNGETEETLLRLYQMCARLVCKLIGVYRDSGADKDDLCSYAYRGIRRAYEHQLRNPHKLDTYRFSHSAYLWISGSLNTGVSNHLLKYGTPLEYDEEFHDMLETPRSVYDITQLAKEILNEKDYKCYENSILYNIPIVKARAETKDTLYEYWDRIDNVKEQLRVEMLRKD